jgi:hypothetical protein
MERFNSRTRHLADDVIVQNGFYSHEDFDAFYPFFIGYGRPVFCRSWDLGMAGRFFFQASVAPGGRAQKFLDYWLSTDYYCFSRFPKDAEGMIGQPPE